MNKVQEYAVNSLELHLFFARIMKEHAFFLKIGFMPPETSFANDGELLMKQFEGLLNRAVSVSDRIISRRVLASGELFTEFTDTAECQTERFTGTDLNRELTSRTMQLKAGNPGTGPYISQALIRQIQCLNRDGLQLVDSIISFKERILAGISSCSLFTVNYPLLIEHILREARLYRAHLLRLEGLSSANSQELRDSELFWNQIMMEHALFIRGLLDPVEDELVNTANDFACEYRRLLKASGDACDRTLPPDSSLTLTKKFRDFKESGVSGIEACRIRSIILPLLADHVLREANHYIRLLES